ncbi:hypothetical protein LUZ60_002544 [Juncus effusus]|nr:hypothetical protein LUZ60_002544 [Juncus effusus]
MARLLHFVLLFLLSVPPLIFLPVSSQAPNDAQILLKFKQGLSDPNNRLNNWNTDKPPCGSKTNISNWVGVLCNNEAGVLGLQLENMGLSGKLDFNLLSGILSLRVLSFMSNNFDGPMPDVKTIVNLKAIYLSNNKLSGEIPQDAFNNMGLLKKVYLDHNKFTGPIPKSLADLPKLLELSLENNEFSGEILNFKQDDLQVMNLSNNDLKGKIPDSIAKMGPNVVTGNKNLCGPPLQNKCDPSSQPSLSSPTSSSTSSSPPPNQGTSIIVVVFIVIVLAVIFFAVIFAIRKKRASPKEKFGLPPSKKVVDDIEVGPVDAPKPMGSPTSSTNGSTTHDHSRLVFVVQGRERFELQDLLKSSAEVLGTSNLGCSYKATLVTNASMVVKRFRDMNRVGKEDFEEHMRRLGRLSHPNLLPLVAYYYRKDEKLLLTDYAPNRSLAHFLHSGDRKMKAALDWTVRLKIVKGVAQGLAYLYEQLSVLQVPHGHLKSSNVLLGCYFEPLLSDYALVPVVNQSHATNAMAAFRSPERRLTGRPSKKSDVWCLGHLILEILTGKPGIPNNDTSVHKGQVHDLSLWVISVPKEEWVEKVIDGDLARALNGSPDLETVKILMEIGLACCEPDMDKRCEMKEAVDKIEELVVIGGEKEKYATSSNEKVEEEFSSLAI